MPKRVLRLGVTGHRTYHDPADVAVRVRQAMGRLLGLAGASARLEILSPLAEGADRLVAREALALPDTTLVAALPFPEADYLTDFATVSSRAEFTELLDAARMVDVMPPTAARDEGYEQVGRWVADHSDALLALWDGEPSRGQGGTAEIVAYAADRGVPLLWVRVVRP